MNLNLRNGSIPSTSGRQHPQPKCFQAPTSFQRTVARQNRHQHRKGRGARLCAGRPGRPSGTAEITDESPVVLERDAPKLPRPGRFQQTLQRSFTMGGLGLHSAEYATVCVKPACANEGRYFVRVPAGTNEAKFKLEEEQQVDIREAGPFTLEPEVEEQKMALFSEYLAAEAQEEFEGSFQDFLSAIDKDDLIEKFEQDPDFMEPVWEEMEKQKGLEVIQVRGDQENVIPAHINSVPDAPQAVALSLGEEVSEDGAIIGPELLLAALECCGVDNARIEIEGGREIPVLDGSALGWAMEIQFAGLRLAPEASILSLPNPEESFVPVERLVALPEQAITVREGSSFITLMPDETMRQTVGLDCSENSPVIGKQWLSWCMYEDPHFRLDISSARRYMESPEEVLALHSMGWLQGGTEGVMLVGFGERWYDATLPRFVRDEPARHEMCNLLGMLALSAKPGHAGLPVGHVVQYKATVELQLQFLRALRDSLSDADYVPIAFNVREVVTENPEAEQGEEGQGEGMEEEE